MNNKKDKPIITFVNHASVIISYDNVNLITDPWLFGSAFNNGWTLICKTKMSTNEFKNITHIWLSHEHPDHFSHTVLKSIPEEFRKKIIFLYHETRDKRVINFCKTLGFSIIEMKPNRRYELVKGFHITCGPYGLIDSWMLAEIDSMKILNLNDCGIYNNRQARLVTKHASEVDVMLTQFSYAGWAGNPEDVNFRKSMAKEIMYKIKTQAEFFKPRFIIPFASFVRFSHADNSYMNKEMNTIDEVNQFIEKKTKANSIILYPGDKWTVGDKHDNHHALKNYKKDFDSLDKTSGKTPPVPMNDLINLALTFIDNLRKRNSWFFIRLCYFIGIFKTVKIVVKDINTSISFDAIHGIQQLDFDVNEADIITDSDSLADVLKSDWGADTLAVNGRYRTSGGNKHNFFRLFLISAFNTSGWSFPFGVIEFLLRHRGAWGKKIF